MPEIPEHAAASKARTGKEYLEVHQWVDHPDHKTERHDITKILESAAIITEKYGAEAAQELVHHIAEDITRRFSKHLAAHHEGVTDTILYFTSNKSKCPKLP